MTVTQAGRDGAAQIFERFDDGDSVRAINCKLGNMDDSWLVGFVDKHREDTERPLLERIEALEAALSLAANRLHRRSLDFDAGTALFIETCEWADEARQALGETQCSTN